jgi:hypothetical protein
MPGWLGYLTDEETRAEVRDLLVALVALAAVNRISNVSPGTGAPKNHPAIGVRNAGHPTWSSRW